MTGTIHALIEPERWWTAWRAAGGRYQVKPQPGGDFALLLLRPPGGDDSDEIERLAWQLDTAPNRAEIIAHKRDAPVEF